MTRRTARDRLRRLLSWPVLVVLGVLTVALGAFGVHSRQGQIEARNINSAVLTARVITSLVVQRNITTANIATGSISADSQEDMDADFAELATRGDLLGLEVWTIDGKRLLYADHGHAAADTGVSADILARVRHGVFVQDTDDGRPGSSLDIVLPYQADEGGPVDAVVEILLPRDTVNDQINQASRQLYGGAALVALLVAFSVWTSVRRHRYQRHAARHDRLTGLGNRALLAEAAVPVLAGLGDTRAAAVLLLDLDGFKEVNDTLGHDAGDDLLVAVAGRLRAAVRPADLPVRLGGDEFAVLAPHLPVDGAVALAEDVRAALRRPIVVSGLDIEIDASVGVAAGPAHGTDLATLLKHADVAMYNAKRTGAGVRVYDPGADPREAEQLTVLGQLRRGIAEGQLRLHYQPKWTADGHIDEVEALVRWQHPQRGLLPPAAFVPLAERTTLIKPLTAWVLTEAARQCARWRATGQDLRIAVNVGARNLLNEDLVDTVRRATDAAHLPIDALRLEITETAVMADPAHATVVLSQLRALGVQVSIDDFGAGYTSLSYLTTLPAKALKIDKRFIDNLLSNALDEAVVRNVIQLARDLGMVSVAEGVESHEAWQRLVDLGCDEIQGYVLSRPLPPDQLITWLETWRTTPDALKPLSQDASGIGEEHAFG